jgi:hypothetical protein
MQPGDGAVELFLCRGRARDRKIHAAEFFRRFVTMIAVLGAGADRTENERYSEQKGAFHRVSPFRGTRNVLGNYDCSNCERGR